MRLLFVSNFYPPHDRGGYEKHCYEIAEGIRAKGHGAHILTSRYGVAFPTEDETVTRSLFLEADLAYYRPVDFFLRRRQQEKYNRRILLQMVEAVQPDLIVFWGMWNLSRNLPGVAEQSKRPVAYWIGDLWPALEDMHTRYWRSIQANRAAFQPIIRLVSWIAKTALYWEKYPPQLAFRYAACGSQFLKRQIAASTPAFNNAKVVLCGVNLELFQDCIAHQKIADITAPRIVYIGALTEPKGVHTLVEAIGLLKQYRPGLAPRLTLIGGGQPPYVEKLHERVEKLNISEQVVFKGVAPNNQIPSLLAEQDILVAPSIVEEGFGRVLVEGMAAGLAVLSTATGAGGEIVQHEQTGLVFPAEEAETLAHSLLRLIDNPALYRQLAQAGKASTSQFDLQRMIDEMEQFFMETIAMERGAVR